VSSHTRLRDDCPVPHGKSSQVCGTFVPYLVVNRHRLRHVCAVPRGKSSQVTGRFRRTPWQIVTGYGAFPPCPVANRHRLRGVSAVPRGKSSQVTGRFRRTSWQIVTGYGAFPPYLVANCHRLWHIQGIRNSRPVVRASLVKHISSPRREKSTRRNAPPAAPCVGSVSPRRLEVGVIGAGPLRRRQ
jgi:hypothetical protein